MQHLSRVRLNIPVVVFALVTMTHIVSGFAVPEGEVWPVPIGYRFQSDSMWFVPVAASILNEGDVDLDEFADSIAFQDNYGVHEFNGHSYNVYPLGPSLIALPFVIPVDLATRLLLSKSLTDQIQDRWGTTILIEVAVASVLVGACSVLMYRIARRHLPISGALILVFVFAFCTGAWSTASRVLWQHGPTMLLLLIPLYYFDRQTLTRRTALFVGVALGLAYVVRPTNAVAVLLFSLYVLMRHRPMLLYTIAGGLAVGIPFLLHNLTVHGVIVTSYSSSFRLSSSIFEGLLGNLISPGRGLFLFTPILALSVGWTLVTLARRRGRTLDVVLLAIVALHWIVISAWAMWWGGHSFGSRFFTDMLPFLCYFLIAPLRYILTTSASRLRAVTAGVTAILIAASFFIHARGALSLETWRWNDELQFVWWEWTYDEYEEEYLITRDHLWDWSRIQFLYSGDG